MSPHRGEWTDLAAPFPPEQVEYLPKQLRRGDDNRGRCTRGSTYCADDHPCGGWHARSIHLAYIGHAGVTMRLNQVDPTWTWEPLALDQRGLPLIADGGMWIKLTVLGVTRLGFGDAAGKAGGPDAIKEMIGDALRNAAMRFGVGTYLWSRSEAAELLKAGGDPSEQSDQHPTTRQRPAAPAPTAAPAPAPRDWLAEVYEAKTPEDLDRIGRDAKRAGALTAELIRAGEAARAELTANRETGEIPDEAVPEPEWAAQSSEVAA